MPEFFVTPQIYALIPENSVRVSASIEGKKKKRTTTVIRFFFL